MCVISILGVLSELMPHFQACAITLPAEISAAAVIVQFWDKDVGIDQHLLLLIAFPNDEYAQDRHMTIYISVFVGMVFVVNLFGAR